jgi:sec-independent protein translocase protein TatB
MFDASLPELVVVFVIALLVLGPQRLPKVAAELGKWVGRARRTATQLRRQLEREIELAEIQPPPPGQGTSGRAGPGTSSPLSPGAREMSDALADSAAGRLGGAATAAGAEAASSTPEPSNAAPSSPSSDEPRAATSTDTATPASAAGAVGSPATSAAKTGSDTND